MKKFVTVLLLLVISSLNSNAKLSDFKLRMHIGWGDYYMDLPKKISEEIIKLTPFNDRIMSNYPGYYNYKFEILFPVIRGLDIGANFCNLSAGSLISYKDYSGEYRYESLIKGYCFGGTINIQIFGVRTPYKVWFELGGGFIKSYFDSEENLTIGNGYSKTTMKFDELGTYIQLAISATYDLDIGEIGINAGYFFDFDPRDKLITDWSGCRASLSFSMQPLRIIN